MNRIVLALMVSGLVSIPLAKVQAVDPLPIGGDPRVDPADFDVSVFASGLDYPYGMVELSDGSLLVATSASSPSVFTSVGELVRFVDADDDGVAGGPGTVLYTGLPAGLTSMVVSGDLIFVAGAVGREISVLRVRSLWRSKARWSSRSPNHLAGNTEPTGWRCDSVELPTPISNGVDTPAVFRSRAVAFFFRHTNSQGVADEIVGFDVSGWLPVAGRMGA